MSCNAGCVDQVCVNVYVCVRVSDTCACGSHDGRWSCLATQGAWIRCV